MQLTIKTNDQAEMIMENYFPENYCDPANGLLERSSEIKNILGNGSYSEVFFEGMHIFFGDFRLKQKTKLRFESDFEMINMHFSLCGICGSNMAKRPNFSNDSTTNCHNIIYVPEVTTPLYFSAGNVQMLEIHLSPKLFKKFLAEADVYNDFLNLIRKQRPALLSRDYMSISPTMLHLINAIIRCTRKGMYKRMYLEAKVIELLLLQLEQFANQDCKAFCSLKSADIEKIFYAKEIILKRYYNPCSLIDLARQVGTNEFTLKKGFKEIFGTTVFGMVAEVKMEQAKQLLLTGGKTISEISDCIGYSHQTHFTKAFKRKFGVAPSEYLNYHALS